MSVSSRLECWGSDPLFSAVTNVRVGIAVTRILMPKILKLTVPVGLAALAYTYMK